MKKVISACLLGINCRYNGKGKFSEQAKKEFEKNECILLCPELLASLGVPRQPCEIVGGDGFDVLDGKAKIIDCDGKDVTKEYLSGAKKAVDIAVKSGVQEAILKSGSPTCGGGTIYDGSFLGKKTPGYGIFAAMLKKNGIEIKEI